jgi:hypothetical protein
MKAKRSKRTGRFLKGTGLGKARPKRRKHKSLGSASCQFGRNRNTRECLKHPRPKRR